MNAKNLKPGSHRPVLHALTGNYRVVVADTPIVVDVTQEDIDHAIPLDPRNCAIAESCRRLGAREAVIGATVAYVVTQLASGEIVAMKYGVPKATRRAIDRFDISGVMPRKGFRLSRMKPSELNKTHGSSRPSKGSTHRKPRRLELRNAQDVISLRNE